MAGEQYGTINYHAAWMQQIEQGRASWGEDDKKARLRRKLVWTRPGTDMKTAAITASCSSQPTQV